MAELFNNLARSTLASGITSIATSLTVQSGDGNLLFPVLGGSDNFRCVLFKKATGEIEIINVTARTADVFTFARAQENIGNVAAAAFAFDAGDLIELRPTGAFFNALAVGASSTNIQQGVFLYGVDTGAANVYTVAMSPTATAIASGQEVRVKIGAGNTNTGIAATLKLDALTAHPITMEGGGNPPAGSIRAGFVHTFNWDGTSFIFKSVGLALTASGHNALGKQIKNVAAGTAASDVSTIGGAETLTAKTLTSPIINTSLTGTGVGRGALVYNVANQALTSGVLTLLQFDSDSYNTDSIHNTVTNNERLTVPTGVTYIKLHGQVSFSDAINAGLLRAQIRWSNGAAIVAETNMEAPTSSAGADNRMFQVSTPRIPVTAAEYFTMHVEMSDTTGFVARGGIWGTNFSMEIIK